MLPHHNGIIDNNADGHNQRKQRQHVDGHFQIKHDAECCHQRRRNADRHPESNAPVQKQKQNRQYQYHAGEPVEQQHIDALNNLVGIDVEKFHLERRRQ